MDEGAAQSPGKAGADMTVDDPSVELSRRRTGMSFQRTRMSADRTLMSVIRTSLSLISFGFTIFQFFQKLYESNELGPRSPHGIRNFGASLLVLGVGMLVVGIIYHLLFMKGLRQERAKMKEQGLIHGESAFPASLTMIVALVLLAIGVIAVIGISFQRGPFS